MTKFQTFIRTHILPIGLIAVLVPLLSLLALQYWSLSKLEETSAVADVVWRKNYLNDVSKEIKFFYKNNAEQVLNIPASSIEHGQPPKSFPFGKCSVEGAKRLFIATFDGRGGAELYFYDPYDQSHTVDPPEDEIRTADTLIAPLRVLNQEGKATSSGMTLEDRDPANRVALKPILDNRAQVIGAAGMIIDRELFSQVYLPQIIRETLPHFFPDEKQQTVVVTVYDERNRVIFSTQHARGQNDDTWVSMPIYSEWRLAICSSNMTPEEWAHWNFKLTLTLSILMSIALMLGLTIAMRAAQRRWRLSRMKTDFVSNVSHELRTPLSSIRVFGELLKMGHVQDVEKVREYGDYIETESRRLTQLINNILDFSRIESGRKTYDFERVSAGDIIQAALRTFDIQLKHSGFTVSVKEPATPLPAIFADPEAISQALINLLDNAVKYSGAAREIEIWLGRAGDFVQISVKDKGIGLSREDQRKVFEKFYRVCTGLVHETRGSGLGLPIVKQIVEAHNGHITVESDEGRGSTFTLHLPIKEQAGETHETRESGREPSVGGGPMLHTDNQKA